MSPLEQQTLHRYGQHPYVSYRGGHDARGQYWVECRCRYCGDVWRKPCMTPSRIGEHAARYALYHAHGLRPVTRR